MENKIEKQNEEALLNAFKIEELEERLEMATVAAPWTKKVDDCNQPGGGSGI